MRPIDADILLDEICRDQCEHKYKDCDSTCEIAAYIVNAPTIGGWISVKDRLPEEDSHVLVWEKQGFAFVDWYKFGVWQLGAENGAIITHWMPLPEPPEEENDE